MERVREEVVSKHGRLQATSYTRELQVKLGKRCRGVVRVAGNGYLYDCYLVRK